MTGYRGFTLIEFVAALALGTGLILVIMQIQQSLDQKQQIHAQVRAIGQIEADIFHYRREHQALPQHANQVWTGGVPEFPGIRSIEILDQEQPKMQLQFWRASDARKVAAKIFMAEQVGDYLRLPLTSLESKISEQAGDQFLHRVAVDGEPELNQMQTDLNMNTFDLTAVGRLSAEQGEFLELWAEQVNAAEIWVDQLIAREWIDVPYVWAEQVDTESLQAESINVTTLTTGVLQAEQIFVDDLAVENLNTEHATAAHITANQVNTDWLMAHSVMAIDIIANGVSFNNLHMRLQDLENSWLQCVYTGGCR